MEVLLGEEEIRGSPFVCRVYDPAKIHVGDIPDGLLDKPVHFTGKCRLNILSHTVDLLSILSFFCPNYFDTLCRRHTALARQVSKNLHPV